jgi:RNA polymerase sigma factor (TIGR02999 family)
MNRDSPQSGFSSHPSRDTGTEPTDDVAGLVDRIRAGDNDAEGRLIGLLYKDLRALAAHRMRRERPDHTWQPTALVNEVLLRLRSDGTLQNANDRAFLLMAASKTMNQLLVDHHRRYSAEKRGGRRRKHPLDAAVDQLARIDKVNPVDLRDELDALGRLDPRACLVVHLRFFLGMSPADVAESLGISQKTVERDWNFARAWLRERLKPTEAL